MLKQFIVPLFLIGTVLFSMNSKKAGKPLVITAGADADSMLNMHLWKLIKGTGDEFNGSSIDTFKWKTGLWYDVSGDFAFRKENILVSNGRLYLTAKKEQYNNKEYTIAAVESKFDLPAEPSLVRVRAKLLPDSVNVCSAIWLQSWPEVMNNPNPEIDIIEYFQRNEMHMNLFTWNKDSAGNYSHVDHKGNIFDYKKDMSATYHIYGLARTKGVLQFYFDDKLVCTWACPNSSFSTMPRHIILSLEGHRYQPRTSLLPASFDIDWVRVYK